MTKSEEKDKIVKISADRHKELKMLSASQGKNMKDIMDEALNEYAKKFKK